MPDAGAGHPLQDVLEVVIDAAARDCGGHNVADQHVRSLLLVRAECVRDVAQRQNPKRAIVDVGDDGEGELARANRLGEPARRLGQREVGMHGQQQHPV